MKASDFLDDDDRYNPGQEDEDILFEMSNFNHKVTGLPHNIEVWVRTDPVNHGHNRYRVKILKDGRWSGIFTVGQDSHLVKNINDKLSQREQTEIKNWISSVSSLIIQLIDGKLDSYRFGEEVKKALNS